jgi:hypothetical protein
MSLDLSHVTPIWPGAVDVITKVALTIIAARFIRSPSFFIGFVIFTIFPPAAIFGLWLFTLAVRQGSGTHLGFTPSVVAPLFIFWPACVVAVLSYFYALLFNITKLTIALFALVAVRLAWALAYGSSVGLVLTLVDLVFAVVAVQGMRAEIQPAPKLKTE